MDEMDVLYRNHNLAVMLATRFAHMLDLEVGVGDDPLKLGWVVLYIKLPTGEQVAWRIPPEEMVGAYPLFNQAHDRHTPAERQERIARFLQQYQAEGAAVTYYAASTHAAATEPPPAPERRPAGAMAWARVRRWLGVGEPSERAT